MSSSVFDNRLRPAVELIPAAICLACGAILLMRPSWFFPLLADLSQATALLFMGWGGWRLWQANRLLRYRAALRTLPAYVLKPAQIPVSTRRLFLGRGFVWDQRHSQRLIESRHPSNRRFLGDSLFCQTGRLLELLSERALVRTKDSLGGDPALHGVGLDEERKQWLPIAERVGHMLVLGTTRVGKSRFAELMLTQDIRRGDVVIVLDPKGDFGLMARVFAEARRAKALDRLHIVHLGYPEWSERYNPVGSFARITEVAGRTASQLPAQGNSAAFREFAWRFTNIVARALNGLGRKPTYDAIARYVTHIEPLLVDYYHLWLDRSGPPEWRQVVNQTEASDNLLNRVPMALRGRDRHALALVTYAKEHNLYDPVADGLRSAFEYDKTYFDKLTASLLPLMEKLTTGPTGQLLAPDYADPYDSRPILDWMKVIREGGIVYVGLDALSDHEVASAVGNAMFADLTSIAGRLYKHGDTHGLPTLPGHRRRAISIHADEFNELVGDEFIPMVNKAGGAGIQVTAYTQTASDVEAGIGSRPKAGQIFGNFNNLVMLRVKNEETARVLTDQLPSVRIYTKVAESRTTDNNDPQTPVDFVSQNADRLSEQDADMITPADLVSLPKGQAFALIEGGRLYKLRLPLAGTDRLMPKRIEAIRAERMARFGMAD